MQCTLFGLSSVFYGKEVLSCRFFRSFSHMYVCCNRKIIILFSGSTFVNLFKDRFNCFQLTWIILLCALFFLYLTRSRTYNVELHWNQLLFCYLFSSYFHWYIVVVFSLNRCKYSRALRIMARNNIDINARQHCNGVYWGNFIEICAI